MDILTVRSVPPARLLKKRKRISDALKILHSKRSSLREVAEPSSREDQPNEPRSKKRRASGSKPGLEDLPWKALDQPMGMGFETDGFMMSLEEVDDVEVSKGDGDHFQYQIVSPEKKKKIRGLSSNAAVPLAVLPPFDDQALLPGWSSIPLAGSLKRSIHLLGFSAPTEIQKRAIPIALRNRDVIGVAETGSGKTLAYGLPILNHILSSPPHDDPSTPRPLAALVLAPTRELAMQVADHLNRLAAKLEAPAPKTGPRPPPRVSVGAIVGGIDAHKQMRIIRRGMDIMIATPGRLWDIMSEHEHVAQAVHQIRFLVLDEADRMIETGHFAELEKILKLTLRPIEEDKPEDDPEFAILGLPVEEVRANESLQTMIFSATLSKDLQKNLKRKKGNNSRRKRSGATSTTLDDLLMRLDFRDEQPEVIDLSPEGGVVSSLQESRVECVVKDKDAYLYYFLLRYPGRSLVFLGAIDGIRRLLPILKLLKVNAIPLHSQLEQKQRLKNLEKFRASPDSVLIATDIAARGLDIPSVDHVVHYQLPRSADVYVHRSGRTARAKKAGFSLLLVSPEERKVQKLLLSSLNRQPDDIPELLVDLDVLDKLKQRVQLARRVDAVTHKQTKISAEQNWLKQTAAELEVDIDPDFIDGATKAQSSKILQQEKNEAHALKNELDRLLTQPLTAHGVSSSYLTSGTRAIADQLLSGIGHGQILGVTKTAAGKNSVRQSSTPSKTSKPPSVKRKRD